MRMHSHTLQHMQTRDSRDDDDEGDEDEDEEDEEEEEGLSVLVSIFSFMRLPNHSILLAFIPTPKRGKSLCG